MPKVGLLWRAEWDPPEADRSIIESCKLREVFAAFAALGVTAEPVIYSDDTVDAVRDQLLGLDGVLVWVNPIEQGLDRSKLDPLLREVADAGVWVSAHPDVISKMATKQVLVDTREMSWGTDTRLYRTAARAARRSPRAACGTDAPRVEAATRHGRRRRLEGGVGRSGRTTARCCVCNTQRERAFPSGCHWTSS